ncbi:MAG: TnpV protein [Bacilli bacterium]|nr:TnpV protein [Bacilli bacterium]
MNISYTKIGDYLLPDLKLEDKERFNIGKYGLLKLEHLNKNKRGLYTELLMKNTLNEYLHDIDINLVEKEQILIKELAEKENITEELKNSNQLLWIGKMNNIKNRVEEIILKEYIYV